MFQLILIFGVVAVLVYLFRSHLSSYDYTQKREPSPKQNHDLVEEYGTVVALMAKVAKADGQVGELEAELISNIFDDIVGELDKPQEMRGRLKEIFKMEKEGGHSVKELAHNFLEFSDAFKQQKILEFLINLAFIDGTFSKSEAHVIEEVAYIFKISPKNYNKILENYRAFYAKRANSSAMNLKQAYELLNCKDGDSLDLVKKAYRKLVKEHHPDIVRGRGENDEAIEKANERLQDINAAYEQIKKLKK